MSTLPSDYTPLESLLLFQALRLNGVESSAFGRISADLQNLPLIYNDPSYNAARLAPDALRQLYLDLLKEEARRDLDKQLVSETATNGDISPNTRKRKAPSPKLPTIREAAQHSHLIPQLLTRLYVRYREIAIASIRDDERRHGALKQVVDAATEIPSSSGTSELTAAPKPPPKRLSQARIDDMLNRGAPVNSERNGTHRRSSSGNSMPSISDLAGIPSQQQSAVSKVSTPVGQYHASGAPAQYQHGHPPLGHASPQLQNLTPRASSSPRAVVLPAPPGALHPASPNMSTQTGVQYQTRVPAQQVPARYAHVTTPNHQYYSPDQQRTPYQPQHTQGYNPNARGGVMLAPFQLNAHEQNKPQYYSSQQQQQQQQYYQQQQHHYRPDQLNYNAPATGPRPQHPVRTSQHPLSGLVAALATPPRQPRQAVWKSETRPPPLSAPGSPKRPDVEPLSPLLARAPSPTHISKRPTASTRGNRRHTSQLETKRELRSASVESGSEDTHASRRIKPEQPSTPLVRDSEERDSDTAHVTSVTATRTRRGTLQSILQPGVKRQRQVSSTRLQYDEDPLPRSSTITATRNLGKMSSVIMNEIISHKHGSRFAQPVRDSQAEGYSIFIKRPQDLKSIRAAITHGGKAIAAASATTADSPLAATATSASANSTVELERSIDHIPPKAIVNGAQLEKEIMRMFANAVLFNPGEDGMVADAREMFEDVEGKIAEWRGAEREAGSADDEDEARTKRRKL